MPAGAAKVVAPYPEHADAGYELRLAFEYKVAGGPSPRSTSGSPLLSTRERNVGGVAKATKPRGGHLDQSGDCR